MRFAWGLVLALFAGCIEPQLQECGDLVCPIDNVCLSNGLCASRDAVTACDGLAEGALCHTTLFDGACTVGACAPARCGDGIIVGSEQCDGVVVDHDCVEFGFDLGVPACNDRCDLDVINSCVNFGWRRVFAQQIDEMWANGSNGLAFVRRSDGAAEVRWNGTAFVDDSRGWQTVTGNATTVFAVRVDALIRSTGGAWESVPNLDLPTFGHAEVTADGTLYMAEEAGCNLQMLPPGGAWTPILFESLTCTEVEATETGLLVGFENGEIRRWVASASDWSVEVVSGSPGVVSIIESGPLLFYALAGGGLYVREGTATLEITPNIAYSLSQSGPFVYYHDGDGGYRRIEGDAIETLYAPTFGNLYVDDTGGIYVYGNGIYQLTSLAFAGRDGVSGLTTDIALLDGDGAPAISTPTELNFHNNGEFWDQVIPPEPITALAGHYRDELFVTSGADLWFFNGSGFTYETPPGFTGITDLWMQPQVDYLVAVGSRGLIMSLDAADNWDTHTAPPGALGCDLIAVAGNAVDLYAVGACGSSGIVWKRSGSTTWTEVYRGGPPLVAVTVASDGEVFAAGPDGGARTRAGVWGTDPGAQGISISATTSTDVFAGGGPDEMVRWDGAVWSRINLPGAISPRVIATPTAVYFAGAAAAVLVRH